MDALPSSLPDLNAVLSRLPESDRAVRSIQVRSFQEQTLFSIKTKDSLYTICADSGRNIKPVTKATIDDIIRKWVNAPVVKTDTLNERDQWIDRGGKYLAPYLFRGVSCGVK